MTDSFPRQQARTQRFSLGAPRSFQISPDGGRVAFLRSQGGSDPLTCLWVLDVTAGREQLVADPATLGETAADIPEQEKARRERSREQAGGIVAYATDSALDTASFALAGEVWVASLSTPSPARHPRRIPAQAPAYDPRPDPTGQRVAYVCHGAVRVTDLASGQDRELIGPAGAEGVTFGLAEFVAAEEMGRLRGYWWAPDGNAVLVARVDNTPVTRWHIADPANPGRPPTEVAYPAAGTANADVSLLLVGLDGTTKPVPWDHAEFPYLVTVDWADGDPLIVVQSRDQRRMRILTADPATDVVTVVREDTAAGHWLDIVPGVPARTSDGRIVWTCDSEGAKRLLIATPAELADGSAQPVTPADLQVREVLDTDGDTVLFTASGKEPTEIGLWAYGQPGLAQLSPEGGVHAGRRAGSTTVIISRSLPEPGATVQVRREGQPQDARIASLAELPDLPAPHPDLFAAGAHALRTALLLPSWHTPGADTLPVLLDPYGGPHAQRVLAAQSAFWTSQWFAEQGFAVLVADGRGTPGRGPDWDRTVAGDLAGPALADQVTALESAAQRCADLDTSRVAIRGWSFGGYLAALAVLRRPDVFHAAVAGAPVTEWRLYDTHYTERYLGHPDERGADYDASSLLGDAKRLRRPLMIIHGLADDNVVAAHTLRLSSALLAAGRPHSVLPLSGVTHMTPQEEVAENLLLLQVDFLRRSLGITTIPGR
ncbi:MAG TPA: prolyl oligopeptidase family serine peptidase [Streptosporangiaceae bacterium]